MLLTPVQVIFGEDRRSPGNDPKHFQAERRHHVILRKQYHRHPADDAVTLGHDRQQAAARGDLFENRNVAEQTVEFEEARFGAPLVAERGKSRKGKIFVDVGHRRWKAGFAEHHTRAPDGVGQHLVVARQFAQLASRQIIQVAHGAGGDVGIEPVGFGENHVECNGDRAKIGEVDDHVRKVRTRPWPLSELLQARFVDVDNGDGTRGLHAGIEALIKIEGPDPKLLDRPKIGDP